MVVGQVKEMRNFAGVLRPGNVCVGNLLAPRSEKVPALMDKFVSFINARETLQTVDIVELAAHAHLWMVGHLSVISTRL